MSANQPRFSTTRNYARINTELSREMKYLRVCDLFFLINLIEFLEKLREDLQEKGEKLQGGEIVCL